MSEGGRPAASRRPAQRPPAARARALRRAARSTVTTRRGASRVRVFRPSDYPEVVRLWKLTGLGTGPSDEAREIERSRRRDPELFLVAEAGGRIVGVVLGRFDGRRGWVNHLAVDPALQHHGLGRRLLGELELRLSRKGCLKVNLHVEPSNRAVVSFYERVGYVRRPLLFLEKWLARAPSGSLRGPGQVRRRAGPPRRR